MDKISVIIPLYKGTEYINEKINLLNNNYDLIKDKLSMEVIFVNDYPEDNNKIPSESNFNYQFPIFFLLNKKNSGVHQSRINGLKKSTGNIIFFLDQDDFIANDYLQQQYNALKDNDIVICNGYQQYHNKKISIYSNLYHLKSVRKLNTYKYYNEIISPGQCLIKRDKIPNYWLENPLKNNGSDDYFLWVLMLLNNCRFKVNQQSIFFRRITGNNFSNDTKKMMTSSIEVCMLLKQYNHKGKKIAKAQMQFLNFTNKQKNIMTYITNFKIVSYLIYHKIRKR